ncbi:MAG: response regulator [Methylococcales bacterium]|nr:response regulator [Methylococcales bacterium]
MLAFFRSLFDTKSYMPHGMCFQWQNDILSMFVISDIVITLAYISIASSLALFVFKRQDISFNRVILAFSLFIFACGATHALSAVTVWTPIYELSAWIKVFTALVSAVTAVMLWPLLPRLLKVPSADDLVELNKHLINEISVHEATKEQLIELTANLDQEVEQRTLKLKRSDNVKSEFIAHVSHELKTPLHGLLGFTQLLEDDQKLTAAQKEKLAIIHQCGDSLLLMIDDLLAIGVHDKDAIDVVYKKFNLLELLSGVEQIAIQQCQGKQIEFKLALLNDLPKYVLGDAKLLRQLLINLVTNAVKFTEVGIVYLRVYQNDNQFCFQVEDTGRGISVVDMESIFDPYYQSFSLKANPGMGLGLSICKKIIEILDSEIRVNSVVNEGSIFEFTLVLESVSQLTVEESAAVMPLGYKGLEQTIMVVDDNLANRLFMEDLLFEKGFNIFSVASGEQCLASVNSVKPDLIFMDLKMPGLNGIETTEKLNENNNHGIVIAMSASASKEAKAAFTVAGGAGFLTKPVSLEALFYCLQQHLAIDWLGGYQFKAEVFENKDKVIRVLVVDDIVVNTHWLKSILQKKGYYVDAIDTCIGAFEKLQLKDYDLMIINLHLYQTSQEDRLKLFLHTKKPIMPVVALENASNNESESHRLRSDVFSYYLELPVDWKKLDGVISAL